MLRILLATSVIAFSSADDKNLPLINLVGKADGKGLPATTIVTAQIDPLRTDGGRLASKLKSRC